MRPLAFLILIFAFAAPALAQDAEPDVDALIESLGSDDWAVRERATRKLIGLGDDAREALKQAIKDDDAEVRVRASRALISIGEEFGFAVECAAAENDRLRDHGRAALMNLFRIDDPRVLRELSAHEQQARSYGYRSFANVMAPPEIAVARMQAITGVRLLVADDAQEAWRRILENNTAHIRISGDVHQIGYVRNGVQQFLQQSQGNVGADERLVPRPMRIGRHVFLYITPAASRSELAARCGEQLVDDLLDDGARSVRAAALLAEGAAGDTKATERIRRQYVENPELNRLMWLALGLGESEGVAAQLAERDHADAVELLATRDWTVMEMAALYLNSLEPGVRGKLLSPRIAASRDTLELSSALWLARGAPLAEDARARAGEFVSVKGEDALAAAAARWFAATDDVTDEELKLIWQAGEFQPIDSSFFTATLELVRRDSIGERILDLARAALKGIHPTQQALAAAVLEGRAAAEDRLVALDKLTGARNNNRLMMQLTELFDGCAQLPEEGIAKFVEGLRDSDKGVRDTFAAALRRCEASLRESIARRVLEENGEVEDRTKPNRENLVRLAMNGVLAGTGDLEALENLREAVEGDDTEVAKAAGAAHVDAFDGDALYSTLALFRDDEEVENGTMAALAGYMEICRRAILEQDRTRFRKAYGIAINMQVVKQNWQLRNQVSRLQSDFTTSNPDGKAESTDLPDPVLTKLELENA